MDSARRATDGPGKLVSVWIVAVCLAHLLLGTVSAASPLTAWEQELPVWPVGEPLSRWVGRVLLAPLERWDVPYYAQIASEGYRADDGTAQFHPLYPLLAGALVRFGVPSLTALLVIRLVASLLFISTFYRVAQSHLLPSEAIFAVLSLVLGPYAVALLLPYPEGLFLLLGVLTLDWAAKGNWLRAGAAGALASLTRQQGLFLLVPLAYLVWSSRREIGRTEKGLAGFWPPLVALSGVPAAYAGFVAYRVWALGEVGVGWGGAHDLIYSLFVSPSAAHVVPVQSFVWPWVALWNAVEKLIVAPDPDIIVNTVGGTWFLVLLALSWRHQPVSHRLYSSLIVLSSFAYYTGPAHPYMGLLRHLGLAFPVFLGCAGFIGSKRGRVSYLSLSVTSQAFLLLLYGLKAWVP